MVLYYTGLAFLSVILVPIGIFFLALINLLVEDMRATGRVRASRPVLSKAPDVSASPLRVVK